MKGRRKVRTKKWQMVEQLIKEARASLARRTEKRGRFLLIAAQTKVEEPVGLLAGDRGALARSPADAFKRYGR
ncbi:hypothetical protein CXB35_27500 [Pseudomonas syringae]|nr:hypothetical protein CXB35_27500 [Pseudomonas syringae]